jgi:hypothetical protein
MLLIMHNLQYYWNKYLFILEHSLNVMLSDICMISVAQEILMLMLLSMAVALNKQAPPCVFHILKRPWRTIENADSDADDCIMNVNVLDYIPDIHNMHRGVTLLLNLLDSYVSPGITEEEFHLLFVKCDCGYILTRRAFKDHICAEGGSNPTRMTSIEGLDRMMDVIVSFM